MIEIDVAIGDQTVYEATLKNGSKHCFRCPGQNNDHGQKNELIAIWTDRNDQIVRFTELEEIESLTARPDIAVSPDALRPDRVEELLYTTKRPGEGSHVIVYMPLNLLR